jgi:hypothetical protein
MSVEIINFPNTGFLKINLTDDQVAPILQEVLEIKENFSSAIKANYGLVGNIKKEFSLVTSQSHIELLLKEYVQMYEDQFSYLQQLKVLGKPAPLTLLHAWVNFQEKHEFNPIHDHTGVFSFVIWLNIPYSIEQEKQFGPGNTSSAPLSGQFSFIYTDVLGTIQKFSMNADKNMENTMILFPARLNHEVYPFYSSDDFRISVSGNVGFQV